MSIDPVAKDLIKKLLVAKPYGRLSRSQEVKDHRWFKAIVWRDVDQRKLVPPIVPEVKFEGDVSNYDEFSVKNPFKMFLLKKIKMLTFKLFKQQLSNVVCSSKKENFFVF
jgi:hypothetical protein